MALVDTGRVNYTYWDAKVSLNENIGKNLIVEGFTLHDDTLKETLEGTALFANIYGSTC